MDQAKGGVNDELAKLLELKNSIILSKNYVDEINSYGYGKIREVDNIKLVDYLNLIKKKLKTDYLIVYGDTNKKISKVAVCGGNSSDFIFDAGHYHTEKIILAIIKAHLIQGTKEMYIDIWDKPSPDYMIY